MKSTVRAGAGQSVYIDADACLVSVIVSDAAGKAVQVILNAHTAALIGAELERAALSIDRAERLAAQAR